MAQTRTDSVARILRESLSPARFAHSVAVSHWAERLAIKNGADGLVARRVGLVHDCAKEWTPSRLVAYVRRHRVAVPQLAFVLKNSPNVLHAYVGAHVAFTKKWIHSPLEKVAIASHTLGAPRMSFLQRVLYVADFTSPDRIFADAKNLRILALEDIDKAFRACVASKIAYQLRHFKPVHPVTVTMWNRLQSGDA